MTEYPLIVDNLNFRYRDREELAIQEINFPGQSRGNIVDCWRKRMWKNNLNSMLSMA